MHAHVLGRYHFRLDEAVEGGEGPCTTPRTAPYPRKPTA